MGFVNIVLLVWLKQTNLFDYAEEGPEAMPLEEHNRSRVEEMGLPGKRDLTPSYQGSYA
jgi:hypothetical protein